MDPLGTFGSLAGMTLVIIGMAVIIKRQRAQRSVQVKVRGSLARRDKDFARVFGSPRRSR